MATRTHWERIFDSLRRMDQARRLHLRRMKRSEMTQCTPSNLYGFDLYIGPDRMARIEFPADMTTDECARLFKGLDELQLFVRQQTETRSRAPASSCIVSSDTYCAFGELVPGTFFIAKDVDPQDCDGVFIRGFDDECTRLSDGKHGRSKPETRVNIVPPEQAARFMVAAAHKAPPNGSS